VDDEVGFTRLLKLNLEATDRFDVRVVNWAEEALAAAQEFQPDLIFLDVMMPRLFGGDVAARIRADARLARTPIVFLSAAVGRERVREHEGVISGYPFLPKPVNIDEILCCIEQQLGPAESTTPGINPDAAPS